MQRRQFITNSALYSATALVGLTILNTVQVKANPFNAVALSGNPATFEPVSTTVSLKGNPVRIHGLCTGTVAVKKAFRTKKGMGLFSKLNILLDSQYTEFMPIWVWVIEHPDGQIVIDTGEINEAKNIDQYLHQESAIDRYQFKHAAKYGISEHDELNHQFEKVNLKLSKTELVVLTHLHLDHTDGLKFFPKTEIRVGETEYKHPNSNMPSTYPSWFKPNLIKHLPNKVEVFREAAAINPGGDLMYIATPGHTIGHSSVLFKTDFVDIIFAGDTSYTQAQVINGELAGVNQNYTQSSQTYSDLLAYSQLKKTIYLPTHDSEAGIRLEGQIPLGKA